MGKLNALNCRLARATLRQRTKIRCAWPWINWKSCAKKWCIGHFDQEMILMTLRLLFNVLDLLALTADNLAHFVLGNSLWPSSSWHSSYNEEVECKARAEEREPYGWWPCKAKKYVEEDPNNPTPNDSDSSELYSVGFVGWGDNHNEILGIEYIRKKSTSHSLAHMKNLHF